jgi:hypothetical protein
MDGVELKAVLLEQGKCSPGYWRECGTNAVIIAQAYRKSHSLVPPNWYMLQEPWGLGCS